MRPLSGLQNRDKLPHLLSTICATRPRWSPRNRENPRQPRSIHRATMKIHAMKKHSPSACRKTGLEFRQIDDKWWFDFEFATVSRRLKSPKHLSLRITPGQSGAEKTFTAAGFHSETTAPLRPRISSICPSLHPFFQQLLSLGGLFGALNALNVLNAARICRARIVHGLAILSWTVS